VNGLPQEDGKIVVADPETAALMAELAPEHAERVYTLPGLPEGVAYVFDFDEIAAQAELPDVDPFRP
jgi:hypothetical protein